jgi:hypothetical protein
MNKKMKKKLFAIIYLGILSAATFAQEAKFYVNKATTTGTECDCGTIKSIKVTIPIPSGVASYDGYYLYMSLNSIDVPAYIYFEKKDIAAKLSGKKEYTAYLLKDDGSSDFTFEDAAFTKKDMCTTPRMWGMTEMVMDASGAGYKLIGSHYEDKWNEYYKKWESTKIDDWDEGVSYGTGSLKVKQRPLSEGFSDDKGVINVKASNADSASYSVSADFSLNGALSIVDKSDVFKTEITYAYFDQQTFSYDALKTEVTNSMSGKFQVGVESPFYYLRDVSLVDKKEIAGKSLGLTKTTINGTEYETVSYYQTLSFEHSGGGGYSIKPGVYATFYIAKIGKYSLIIMAKTEDEIEENTLHTSFGEKPNNIENKWFTVHFKESDISKIDKIVEKWLNATTYKTLP